jgi:hypothetical protein
MNTFVALATTVGVSCGPRKKAGTREKTGGIAFVLFIEMRWRLSWHRYLSCLLLSSEVVAKYENNTSLCKHILELDSVVSQVSL